MTENAGAGECIVTVSTRKKFRLFAVVLCLLLVPLTAVWHYRLDMLAWCWLNISWRHPLSLRLHVYRVMLDAYPVEGVTRNLSGLTYNARTGTLFSVVNDPAQILEMTTEGQLLRTIPVTGIHDLEGIAHVDGSRFVLIDERDQQICWIRIDARTQRGRDPCAASGVGASDQWQ